MSFIILRSFFSYNHPAVFIFLLGLSFALRIPSFHPNYLSTDESFYTVSAQKIAAGGVQYIDTQDNKPPVIAWFYTLFVWIFGSHALLAIRIFTCLYLFACAVLLNQMILSNKLLPNSGLLPGVFFLLLCSVPWYAQEMNAEMLMLLPLIMTAWQIFQVGEDPESNNFRLLIGGALLGLSFMIKYQAIFFFIGFFIANAVVNPPRFSEFFTLVAGFFLSFAAIILIIYFTGALDAWWNIGFLYNIDYMRVGKNPGENIDFVFNLMQYLKLWGAFLFAGIMGLLHFRFNYFTYAIRHRKMEAIFFFWFVAAILTIVVGGSRLYLHYFICVVPPLAFYAAKFFEMIRRAWIRFIFLLGSLVFPVYTWGVYLAAAYPQKFSFADQYFEPMLWVNWWRDNLNKPHPLAAKIDASKVKRGILVMDVEPEIYMRLHVPCATPYTNFSIAYYKFGFFAHNKGRSLISGNEKEEDIYHNFKNDMPEYIVDRFNLFPQMKERFPLLFEGFKEDSVSIYKVYSKF